MSFFEEIKTFAAKGNVVDVAVGILVGNAFNRVVNSIVTDLFMPPIGYLVTGTQLNLLEIPLKTVLKDGVPTVVIAIKYGVFLNALIEFGIVVLSAFFVVKAMNRLIAIRLQDLRAQVEALQSAAEKAGVSDMVREVKAMLD